MKLLLFYLRINKLLIKVAGRQNKSTKMSANARLTMKKLVTVLIRGVRNTIATTKQLPTIPMTNTMIYAIHNMIDTLSECRIRDDKSISEKSLIESLLWLFSDKSDWNCVEFDDSIKFIFVVLSFWIFELNIKFIIELLLSVLNCW